MPPQRITRNRKRRAASAAAAAANSATRGLLRLPSVRGLEHVAGVLGRHQWLVVRILRLCLLLGSLRARH